MNTVEQWLRLEPLDTLFCKGSESMIAGQDHQAKSVFPPMPGTLIGSIRTAIMFQRGIPFRAFTHGKDEERAGITTQYPILGTPEKAGFEICGPLFGLRTAPKECFIPAPAHWFGPSIDRLEHGAHVTVQTAATCPKHIAVLGLKGNIPSPLLVRKPLERDMKSLAGKWVNRAALEALRSGKGELCVSTTLDGHNPKKATIALPGVFYAPEIRTGIALEDRTRQVRKGYLYSFTQVRLHPDVCLFVGLSALMSPTHLDAAGMLQLGGEQRLVRYETITAMDLPDGKSSWTISLGPIQSDLITNSQLASCPRASGALLKVAGWDMKRAFHKPVTAFFPAGTAIETADMETPFGFLRI